jgi:hypothetical protein
MAKSVEKVLELLDFNINMFSGYKNESSKKSLEEMIREREEIIKMQAGEIEYKDMSYGARNWFFEMPEWGTKGT